MNRYKNLCDRIVKTFNTPPEDISKQEWTQELKTKNNKLYISNEEYGFTFLKICNLEKLNSLLKEHNLKIENCVNDNFHLNFEGVMLLVTQI